jgi:RNA polymerase sigma-70 factor (ECF subfamily)
MQSDDQSTEGLLTRVANGETQAVQTLLALHRERLKRMVAIYFDDRLSRRADPSDVVQETLVEAAHRLSDYVRKQPLPFYPWLRQLAREKLLQMKRHHLVKQKRAVRREAPLEPSDASAVHLSERLVATGTGPGDRLMRAEEKKLVRAALDRMKPRDREVLVLRYLEQLSTAEATAVLGISEEAYMKRHFRAIARLRQMLRGAGGISG